MLMRVYEALAEAFADEGTSAVFGLMGDANMHWMNALAERGVSMYTVRHEGAGLAMADGWARVSGQPGVCTTTSGPGTSQLATTMLVASRARTPLVAFCGDLPDGDESGSQHLDQRRFAAAIEAGFVRVSSAGRARESVRAAFHLARSEQRPVMLSVPSDLQQQTVEAVADGDRTATTGDLPLQPHPDAVRAAAELVASSERTVIVVGRGAMRSGAGDAVRRLAATTGGIVATTLLAKGFLGEEPYSAGIAGGYGTRTARALFREADCVVAVGASLSGHTTDDGKLFPHARIVRIDTAPRPFDGEGDGPAADCHVRGDARLAVELIAERLEQWGTPVTGYRTPEVRAALSTAHVDDTPVELEPRTVDPRAACTTLDERLPSDVAIVFGSGHQVRFPVMLMNRPRPYTLAQHHFGCIGQGLTVGMGACIASGRRPVCVVEGDAGFMMHLAEFETAVRYDLPLLVVVMNDEAIGAEYHKSKAIGLSTALTEIPTPDLGAVGRALGGRGALVRSVADLAAAADEFVATPGPFLVDVRISRTVLNIPYRRHWYAHDA